ncbi:relaxase/mobilization nuclease domain-containing protein [Leptolyngbya sp. AN03gr2]|uniref:relaxase/mobilization nuclease domain-containing protein n=1 Tax=unclassified Leptolyngbya TaxID=2650499 RepID=UPI003D318ADF
MIGKIVQGKSFRGLLNYLHGKEEAQWIGGNMAGETPRELAAEFRVARTLNRRLKKAVCHVSLSLPKHERLDNDQWLAIAADYVSGMGYENCQYVVYRHHDQDHDHVHLAVCRIRMTDGRTVSDSWEKRRAEALIRSLEQQYQLESVQPSWEKLEAAPTTGEMRRFERTGELPVRVRLQVQIDQAAEKSLSIAQFIHQLKAQGVEVRLRIENQRITGISYCLNDVAFSGSKLGRAYTFPGLQKYKGFHYDYTAEFERTCQAANSDAPEPRLDAAVVTEFERIAESLGSPIAQSRNGIDRNQAIPELPATASSRTGQLPTASKSAESESATNEHSLNPIQSASLSSGSNRQQSVRAANPHESGTSITQKRDDCSGTESGSDSSIVPRLQPIVSPIAGAANQPRRQDGAAISSTDTADRANSAGNSQQNSFSSEVISERGSRDVSRDFGDADFLRSASSSDCLDSATASTPSQPEPSSSTGQQQRDSTPTPRTRAGTDFEQTWHSATEKINVNEDQRRWQRYSLGVQASNTVKLNQVVARRAFEDGQSPQAIARMLAYSPFVQEMVGKDKSSEKIQAYIRQTVHETCQREQQHQRKQQKQRSLNLGI